MIKNLSCSAIKIFLIPYDFRDMPIHTKTFIRQKSYAVSQRNPGGRLKFAIHLNFQMSAHKHLYLTSHLRVVFSSLPVENDERLKIVYQGPTFPKYSPVQEASGSVKEGIFENQCWLQQTCLVSPEVIHEEQGR